MERTNWRSVVHKVRSTVASKIVIVIRTSHL